MVRRTNGRVWMWSLLAACILTGIFYVLPYISPFTRFFRYYSFIDSQPLTVTVSMIISEFTMSLSRFYSHLSWASACLMVIAFFLYIIVGWWTARRTGIVKTGFRAGLWAGLFYGLINFAITSVNFLQLMRSFSTSGHDSYALHIQTYITTISIVDDISGFLFGFVVFGLLAGILGGICGGLLGRCFSAPPGTFLL